MPQVESKTKTSISISNGEITIEQVTTKKYKAAIDTSGEYFLDIARNAIGYAKKYDIEIEPMADFRFWGKNGWSGVRCSWMWLTDAVRNADRMEPSL